MPKHIYIYILVIIGHIYMPNNNQTELIKFIDKPQLVKFT